MPQFPLSLRLIAVGKIGSSPFAATTQDYAARLRRYLNLEVHEVKTAIGKGRPDAQAIAEEGRALKNLVRDHAALVALVKEGRRYSSESFARMLHNHLTSGNRQLDFVIGGPLGLSEELTLMAHERLSLSNMTFSHELARVVLLEQLYRACTILRGEKYHK